MENHFSYTLNMLPKCRATIGLATSIIAILVLLSPAMGCTTAEPAPTETDSEADRSQTQHETIFTEEAGNHFTDEPEERLIDAVDQGDIETLRRLLQEGADPNETDAYGTDRPLWPAVALENFEMAKLLLSAGADPNIPSRDGISVAFLAVQIGNPEILAAVTEAGGRFGTVSGNEVEVITKALHRVLLHRNAELLRVMIESGVDPNTQVPSSTYLDANADGVRDLWLVPILHEALGRKQADMVQVLLDAGADPNATGFFFLLEEDPGNPQENIAALFGLEEDPNIKSGPYGNTPLREAIWYRNIEMVEILLAGGADTEMLNRREETALIAAIESGDTEIARLVIEAGANLNAVDQFGATALELAERAGTSDDREMYKLLLEAGGAVGSDLDAAFATEDLYDAIMSGEVGTVQNLINAGADVNAMDSEGRSMLEWAIIWAGLRGYSEIVRVLVEAGADVNAEVVSANSFLQLAAMYDKSEVVRILTDAGASK